MKILYIHGFNSAYDPNSPKIKALAKIGTILPYSYDSFEPMMRTIMGIELFLEQFQYDDVLLVGCSYGAYLALRISMRTGVPAVALNPVIDVEKAFADYDGRTFNNYVIPEQKKTFKLQYFLMGYYSATDYIKDGECWSSLQPLIAVEMGDEVIDSQETINSLVNHKNVVALEGGSHRFDQIEKLLPLIEMYANRVFTTAAINFAAL